MYVMSYSHALHVVTYKKHWDSPLFEMSPFDSPLLCPTHIQKKPQDLELFEKNLEN